MKYIFFFAVLLLISYSCMAQGCPPNIDFENGTFDNWQCIDGRIRLSEDVPSAFSGVTLTNSNPIPGRHEIISDKTLPATDFYGKFPVLAPNGSNYSIKIGNTENGGLVTGVKYNVQIPANDNKFYLQYNYAVVYESPNHAIQYQPRFIINVKDLATNEVIDCSSLVFYADPAQPDFFVSAQKHFGIQVLYKKWAPATLLLNNMAGKNVEISFIVTGCAYAQHFGYAYLDVSSKCAERFPGSSYCKTDTSIRVQGPSGYETYRWYSPDFSQILSTSQDLVVKPPPPPNTLYTLITKPFYKPDCRDTFKIKVADDLVLIPNAGKDTVVCQGNSIRIGGPPVDGVIYKWTPAAGLSDPNISNPVAYVTQQTKFSVTASSFGGGCKVTDDVLVAPLVVNTKLTLEGKDSICVGAGDSTILMANTTYPFTWYKDNLPITNATGNKFSIISSGKYFAHITIPSGCEYNTDTLSIYAEQATMGMRYPTISVITGYNFDLKARPMGKAYLWTPSTGLNNNKIVNPKLLAGTAPVTYLIKITTAGGCNFTDTLSTIINSKIAVYVPSAFTPNGDGVNDFLKPVFSGFEKITSFKVFNRYGQQVFDGQNNTAGWDGRIKSEMQPLSAYIWIAEGVGIDKKVYREKGTILLLR